MYIINAWLVMQNKSKDVRLSKALSYFLRHGPKNGGLQLMNGNFTHISLSLLITIKLLIKVGSPINVGSLLNAGGVLPNVQINAGSQIMAGSPMNSGLK